MKELQRKQYVKRLMYSIPSLIILAILCFLLVKGAIGVINKERESAQTLRELEAKRDELTLREKELEGKMARIQTQEGLYEAIKEKFSVTREGEHVAIIVDERKDPALLKESGAAAWLKSSWAKLKSLWTE